MSHLVRALMDSGAAPHCFVHGTPSDVRGKQDPNKYAHPWLDLFTGERWWCVQQSESPAEAEKEAASA